MTKCTIFFFPQRNFENRAKRRKKSGKRQKPKRRRNDSSVGKTGTARVAIKVAIATIDAAAVAAMTGGDRAVATEVAGAGAGTGPERVEIAAGVGTGSAGTETAENDRAAETAETVGSGRTPRAETVTRTRPGRRDPGAEIGRGGRGRVAGTRKKEIARIGVEGESLSGD